MRICYGYINQYAHKMNLYIFNETNPATSYGIGTYIKELVAVLKNSGVNVCVVNLNSDKLQIMSE